MPADRLMIFSLTFLRSLVTIDFGGICLCNGFGMLMLQVIFKSAFIADVVMPSFPYPQNLEQPHKKAFSFSKM
jgi:hypothetical protein